MTTKMKLLQFFFLFICESRCTNKSLEQKSRLLVLLECWCCGLLLCGCMNMYVRNKTTVTGTLYKNLYKHGLLCLFWGPVILYVDSMFWPFGRSSSSDHSEAAGCCCSDPLQPRLRLLQTGFASGEEVLFIRGVLRTLILEGAPQ